MKRTHIRSAIALFAVTSVLTAAAVSADKKYSPDELISLRNYLHGADKASFGTDVNSDGAVDIFDLISMRKNTDTNTASQNGEYYASEENVRYIGRNCYSNNIVWLVQSGSAIEFTVSGRSAEVTLKGDSSIKNGPDYRSRYAVIVDDEIIEDSTMSDESKTVKLFDSDKIRTANVKVIHLSEAANGAIGVASIKVDSVMQKPVAPTEPKKLKIEFIGDSITCAYGVEGASNTESFKTTTENFMKSYAYLTAKKLDADYSAVSYSGHGIVSGYTSDGSINTKSLVPQYYEQIGSWKEYSQPWDFTKAPNDVVVINLGTNDCTYVDKDMDERSKEFTKGYTEFLKTVRKNNPDAYIICTLGTMGCNQLYPCIEQAIADFKAETGDERISSYESVTQVQSDGYGSDWHPSPITQQKSAYVLADKICQALGIESDGIGLDFAADAEYTLRKDEESGASAWPYQSDYDRSYNVNVISGGNDVSSLEIVAAPIKLVKGGKYRLTFNCTASAGTESIPVIIQSSSGEKYFSGTLEGSGDKLPFEAEFTSAADDDSSEFVMQIGGADYSNVTLYNLRIEKIG